MPTRASFSADEIASQLPLVSVICTSYNHEKYIGEALTSVMEQTYPRIELIVVDNASTDTTVEHIQEFCTKYSAVPVVLNSTNKGLCTAFNQGLELATGKYIIDLSADDVLLPTRVARQVAYFEELDDTYGVIFSNAQYIDSQSHKLAYHYPVDQAFQAREQVPTGDVYRAVLERYFICTPTMMMKKSVLDRLGGYDETLAYEDFDFWVRSAVLVKYGYQDEVLTEKRILRNSLSNQVYNPGSGMLESTYTVCNKAYDLNRTQEEFDALARRVRTYIRKSFYAQEFEMALKFRNLLNYIEDPGMPTEIIVWLCRRRVPVNRLYSLYLDLRVKYALRRTEFA